MRGVLPTERSKIISTFLVHKAVHKLANHDGYKAILTQKKNLVLILHSLRGNNLMKRKVMCWLPQLSYFKINEVRRETSKLERIAYPTP